jgi:D-aspartate ligase
VSVRKRRGGGATTPGAVVIGGDYQGLGVVRSLGRHGIPAWVVEDEPSIARHSRYATGSVRVPPLRDDRTIVESLLSLSRTHPVAGFVLYATRDEVVAALSRNREELAEAFRVPTPSWDSIRWTWDKRLTYQMAREIGIPTPVTSVVTTDGALPAETAPFPLVIKPAIKEHFIYATKVKAWRADTPSDLDVHVRRACEVIPADEVMLQELIPGPGSRQFSYCAFFKDGQARAVMTARRLRQRPLDFGRSSTYVETVDVPAIEELSQRFLAAIDYYGLVEIEYKLDERDGSYKLLDVNPRTWGYHSLGAAAGTDFPLLLHDDQTGRAVGHGRSRARAGVSWVRLTTDLPTAFSQIAGRQLEVRAYIRSLASADAEAAFSRDDPLPGLAEWLLIPYLYRTRVSHQEPH